MALEKKINKSKSRFKFYLVSVRSMTIMVFLHPSHCREQDNVNIRILVNIRLIIINGLTYNKEES